MIYRDAVVILAEYPAFSLTISWTLKVCSTSCPEMTSCVGPPGHLRLCMSRWSDQLTTCSLCASVTDHEWPVALEQKQALGQTHGWWTLHCAQVTKVPCHICCFSESLMTWMALMNSFNVNLSIERWWIIQMALIFAKSATVSRRTVFGRMRCYFMLKV